MAYLSREAKLIFLPCVIFPSSMLFPQPEMERPLAMKSVFPATEENLTASDTSEMLPKEM